MSKEKLTLDQLRKEQAYLNLTDPQRRMVETFLQTGSKLKAVQAAFNCASEKTARVMTYSYFAKAAVIACLAISEGADPERAQFNVDLERAIKNPKLTRNQLSALRLKAQLYGYLVTLPEPTAPARASSFTKFVVGQLVTERDEKGVLHTGIIRTL